MLNEMMTDLIGAFDARQNALIAAVGGSFKEVLSLMHKHQGPFYGNPPFIVDDGETPLLLVRSDGEWSRLPPTFSLSESAIEKDFDAIYSVPVVSFGLIRFIPAATDFQFPNEYQGSLVVTAFSPQLLNGLEKYLDVMVDAIPKLAALGLAKNLIQLQAVMEVGAEEADVQLSEYMQMDQVQSAFISVLGEALVDGAHRAVNIVQQARAESAR